MHLKFPCCDLIVYLCPKIHLRNSLRTICFNALPVPIQDRFLKCRFFLGKTMVFCIFASKVTVSHLGRHFAASWAPHRRLTRHAASSGRFHLRGRIHQHWHLQLSHATVHTLLQHGEAIAVVVLTSHVECMYRTCRVHVPPALLFTPY